MFKDFDLSKDVSIQLSSINEVMAISGTYMSGTNYYTKNFINITSGSAVSGGFWTTIYDGSPTSTSSSALFDLMYGHNSSSVLAGYSETFENTEKQRIYEQMASYLLNDKNAIFSFGNINYRELFFINLKRRIFKDEIAKGYTSLNICPSGAGASVLLLSDAGAASTYSVGKAGDEATLYSGSTAIGKVYYNAGVVAFATGVFFPVDATQDVYWSGSVANKNHMHQSCISGSFDNIIYGLKQRINNVQFHNQTNLHSTIYFCRALNGEFNYSSNPTFIDSDGRIVPTSGSDNQTRTYITSVGLYSINNELLGVAKLSEPIKKGPDGEVTVRIRISY